MTTWLTAHQAAAHATRARRALSAGAAAVTERTVRSWVARGHLAAAGHDERGQQLFRLADVAQAERATRTRALRLAGIPEHP
jgi:DNA-binding transcriptional MerR regulator